MTQELSPDFKITLDITLEDIQLLNLIDQVGLNGQSSVKRMVFFQRINPQVNSQIQAEQARLTAISAAASSLKGKNDAGNKNNGSDSSGENGTSDEPGSTNRLSPKRIEKAGKRSG